MRALHLIDSLSMGGAQTFIKGILEHNFGNDNIYLYALRESKIMLKIKHCNVITHAGTARYSFKPLLNMKILIEKDSIDIIHCHLFRSQLFGWLLKKLYFPDIILIYHEHGKIFNNSILYKLFIKCTKSKVDLYIAVSKATKRHLINYANAPEEKIRILYNFVNFKRFDKSNVKWNTSDEREKLGFCRNDFVVGFAGRLVKRKGWRTFIDAAALILKEQTNVTFLIAGDGDDKNKMLDLINKKKLSNKVKYLGYVADMVWFYSLLDCFIIPSYWEPMGLTEIEAQAMGVPVISSDVEALNEIMRHGENGLLFTSKDGTGLAAIFLKLITDQELKKSLVLGGYETVKVFSLEDYNEKLSGIYKELL